MDILSLSFLSGNNSEENNRLSDEAKSASKAIERKNIVAICRLILDSFLDEAIRGSRIEEFDRREILDFLFLFEKILFHGFSPYSLMPFRSAEANLWTFFGLIASKNDAMEVTYKSIEALKELKTPISKVRAFWRLSLIEKHFSNYFKVLFDSDLKSNYYEEWALLRNEESLVLCGSFIALNVFDFNLIIDNEHIQRQSGGLHISPYLKLPTVSGHLPNQGIENEFLNQSKLEESLKNMAVILDQKQFLEEQNRLLHDKIEKLQSKVEEQNDSFASASINSYASNNSTIIRNNSKEERSLAFNQRLRDLENERDILQARLTEKEDTVRMVKEQMVDTKRFTENLYEQLRSSESKVKRLKKLLQVLKDTHAQELSVLNKSLDSLRVSHVIASSDEAIVLLRNELSNKTRQYLEAMSLLNEKQHELANECEKSSGLQRHCNELKERVHNMEETEKELANVREKNRELTEELNGCQQALQEFNIALSESKQKMVELKEEIGAPVSASAEWVKDNTTKWCRSCGLTFSLTQRRHHCRSCGQVFCNECSKERIRLPSNEEPVRVCLGCYRRLNASRQSPSISSLGV